MNREQDISTNGKLFINDALKTIHVEPITAHVDEHEDTEEDVKTQLAFEKLMIAFNDSLIQHCEYTPVELKNIYFKTSYNPETFLILKTARDRLNELNFVLKLLNKILKSGSFQHPILDKLRTTGIKFFDNYPYRHSVYGRVLQNMYRHGKVLSNELDDDAPLFVVAFYDFLKELIGITDIILDNSYKPEPQTNLSRNIHINLPTIRTRRDVDNMSTVVEDIAEDDGKELALLQVDTSIEKDGIEKSGMEGSGIEKSGIETGNVETVSLEKDALGEIHIDNVDGINVDIENMLETIDQDQINIEKINIEKVNIATVQPNVEIDAIKSAIPFGNALQRNGDHMLDNEKKLLNPDNNINLDIQSTHNNTMSIINGEKNITNDKSVVDTININPSGEKNKVFYNTFYSNNMAVIDNPTPQKNLDNIFTFIDNSVTREKNRKKNRNDILNQSRCNRFSLLSDIDTDESSILAITSE